jgi:hypothetical protein
MSPSLAVRVHPGARRAGVTGRLADGTWKLAVAAAPEGGRANRALEELVAGLVGVRRAQVAVTRGGSGRSKRVDVRGLSTEELTRRMEAALARNEEAHDE